MSTPLLYRLGVRAAVWSLPLVARFHRKAARAHQARLGLGDRLTRWGERSRDPRHPLVWMHATSVGEGLHAKPVLEKLRELHPDWQLFFSYFSPSAERFAQSLDVDGRDCLPFDTPQGVHAVIETLRPHALVYAHTDVWPELTQAAVRGGVPTALVSAVVAPHSSRLRWLVTRLVRSTYGALTAVGAASEDDAKRLRQLGVQPQRLEILGDARYDSAAARARRAPRSTWAKQLRDDRPTLVAGSTWPRDECVLLAAFQRVRSEHPAARLIIAPHEPSPSRLAEVAQTCSRRGLPTPVALAELERHDRPSIVVVDRVGVLADLYTAGEIAYVGGGFGPLGLHSVLEPAASGRPVLTGPRWQRSRDARLLHAAGALVAVPSGRSAAGQVARQWREWMTHHGARREAARSARAVVQQGEGAAARTVELVERLVTSCT